MSAIVGSAGVEVVPSVRNFARDLRAKLLPEAKKLGDDLGKDIGDAIRRRLDVSLQRLPTARINADVDTTKAQAKLRTEFAKLPDANIAVNANVAAAKARVEGLRTELSRNSSFTLKANADISAAQARIAGLRAELAEETDTDKTIKIKADIKDATTKLAAIRAQKAQIDAGTSAIKVRLDGASAALTETKLDALTRARIVPVDLKVDENKNRSITKTADKVAAKLDKLAPLGSAFLSPMVALGAVGAPAIVGFGAAALPVFGGIAATMLPAAVGTGAFAAIAVPAYKKITTSSQGLATAQQNVAKAQKAVADATTKAQKNSANKKLADALDAQSKALRDLTPAEAGAVTQYNAFSQAVKDFEKQNEPEAFSVIGGGFKLITSQLPKATPLIKGAAGAFSDLEADASKALNSKFWGSFEQFVDRQAPKSIKTYGQVAGNVVTGLFGVVQGFEPQINTVDQGVLGLSRDLAHFGEDAAAGKSKGFNQFVDFSHNVAPQVKSDLKDITGLVGDVGGGLAPSVQPALKLIGDVAKDLGPVITPIEQKFPGIITDVDKLVTKISPLAPKVSAAFSSGAAKSIHSFASGIGDLAGFVNKLPEPVLHAIGVDIGIIATSAALSKLTGLSKLGGFLRTVGTNGVAAGAGLDATAAGERNLAKASATSGIAGGVRGKASGSKGGKLATGLANLPDFAFDAFIGGSIGEQIGRSKTVEKFSTDFEHLRNNAEKLPGPLGSVAKDLNKVDNAVGDHLPGFLKNVQQIGGKGTEDMSKFVAVTEKLPNLAKPITVYEKVNGQKDFEAAINRAKAKAQDLANTKVVTKVEAKDAASHIINGVKNAAAGVNGTPAIAHLSAQDKASVGIARVKAGLGGVEKTPGIAHLSAQDRASTIITRVKNGVASIPKTHDSLIRAQNDTGEAAAAARAAIDSIKDKQVTVSAIVNGLGSVGALGSEIGGLRDKTVTVTARQVGSVGGLGHFAGNADGGKIRGPGTPTSDTIPRMLSRDEWVINARRSQQLGDSFMSWVNYGAGKTPPNFQRRLAAGGPVNGSAKSGDVAGIPPITLISITQLDGKEIQRSTKKVDVSQARARRARR